MKYKARIARLRRLLLARHAVYPQFIVQITDDGGNITQKLTYHLRFA